MEGKREMCVPSDTRQTAWPWRFRRLARNERGVELLEAALVFPALLALLIGVFWLGRAYNVYQTITRAAREGARFALAPSCGTCSPANTFPTDPEVTTVINNALSASSLNPAGATNLQIQRIQPLNSDPPPNQVFGVIVSFGYPMQLRIPFTPLNATTITITTKVQMRQEL